MRALKITGWIILGLAAAIAVALAVLLVAPKSYLGLLQAQLNAATGYQLNVDTLQVDLFPPRLAATELRLRNPDITENQQLLAVAQLELKIDASRYFTAAPTWWQASASGIKLQVADLDDGSTNWSRPQAQNPASANGPEGESSARTAENSGPSPLFRFSQLDIAELDFSRITNDDEITLTVSKLQLIKQPEEHLQVKLAANYRDQPLSASGTLALPRSGKARDVDFTASVFGSDITLDGTIGSDGITPGKASFSVQSADLTTLGKLLNQDLRPFSPIKLTGNLQAPEPTKWRLETTGSVAGHNISLDGKASSTEASYTLQQLSVKFGASSVAASGTFNSENLSIEAELSSEKLALDPLLALFASNSNKQQASSNSGWDPAQLMHWAEQWTFAAAVRLDEVLYQQYQARDMLLDINSEAEAMLMTAEIGSLAATAMQASANSLPDDSQPDSSQPDSTQPDSTSPDSSQPEKNAADISTRWQVVSPLSARVKLGFKPQPSAGWPLSVTFNTTDISGEVTTAITPNDVTLTRGKLSAEIASFAAINGLSTARWDTFLPLAVNVDLSREQSVLQFDPFTLAIKDNVIEGNATVDRSQTPLAVSGSFRSSELDLNNFATTSAQMLEGSGENVDKDSGDIIKDEPLSWSWLNAARADIGLTLDVLRFNQTVFREVTTQLTLSDGTLTIEPFDANLSQGKVRGHASVKQTEAGGSVDGRLLVAQLTPADLGQQDTGLIDGGATDLLLELRAEGNTPQQLAASLNGEMALEIQGATIRNNLFEVIGSDLLLRTINLINPFANRDPTTELECAAMYFKAEKGVLTSPDQLVIETSKIKIRGGGTINLRDESLRIDFVPTPRDGLGISLSNLASVVRIGGTLGQPQPVADPSGLLKAGGTIGAAIATGGLSLLGQGLFDRIRSAGTACGKIFDTVPEAMNEQQN